MKVFSAALAVLLMAAALCAPASASPYASDTTPCCFAYLSRPLPRNHVQEYFYTSSKCSMAAVVTQKSCSSRPTFLVLSPGTKGRVSPKSRVLEGAPEQAKCHTLLLLQEARALHTLVYPV
uniref:HEAT repeat containing 9 n=1 Tax=Ovis aries TaxID=9940 RepID=A0AC11ERI1_SHEEP